MSLVYCIAANSNVITKVVSSPKNVSIEESRVQDNQVLTNVIVGRVVNAKKRICLPHRFTIMFDIIRKGFESLPRYFDLGLKNH